MINHNQCSGFTFKQFHVAHDRCAMKVGTDGILLAAWLTLPAECRLLDVGCGTGLISLMLAQRMLGNVQIDAIDIDADACQQTRQNVAHSPWPEAIQVFHQSMQQFSCAQPYSLIVSNPPYFPAGQVFEHKRQQARHDGDLSAEQFFSALQSLSDVQTRVGLILPCTEAPRWLTCAATKGWLVERKAMVRSLPHKAPIRMLLLLSKQVHIPAHSEQILIYQEDKNYSPQYVSLCRDFYLNM